MSVKRVVMELTALSNELTLDLRFVISVLTAVIFVSMLVFTVAICVAISLSILPSEVLMALAIAVL